MFDVNKAILVGRLGANPVVRPTKSGMSRATFPLATSRYIKSEGTDGESEGREETQWHQVVAWGKQAERCAKYLSKGQPVFVEGTIRSRKYEKEGENRYFFEIHAERFSFFGKAQTAEPVTEEAASLT